MTAIISRCLDNQEAILEAAQHIFSPDFNQKAELLQDLLTNFGTPNENPQI